MLLNDSIVNAYAGVPCVMLHDVSHCWCPIPRRTSSFLDALRHAVHIAAVHHKPKSRAAHHIIVGETGLADDRQTCPKIMIDLGALVVVHEGTGGYDDTDVGMAEIVPR